MNVAAATQIRFCDWQWQWLFHII